MQSYLLVTMMKTSTCSTHMQGRCLTLKRLSNILWIFHKTQHRMPDPAIQIADVMFLRYTGGKSFPRSLHEKLRIIERTAERKKNIVKHTVSKRLLNFFFIKTVWCFTWRKTLTTGTWYCNRPVQLSHNPCLKKVN